MIHELVPQFAEGGLSKLSGFAFLISPLFGWVAQEVLSGFFVDQEANIAHPLCNSAFPVDLH